MCTGEVDWGQSCAISHFCSGSQTALMERLLHNIKFVTNKHNTPLLLGTHAGFSL